MYILFTKLFFLKYNCIIKCLHDCLSPRYWQACVLTSLSMSRLIMVLASSENQHFHCWNPDGKKKKKLFTVYIHIKNTGCEATLRLKAELSPETVRISVPFAPEAKVKISVNILINNSFFFLLQNKLSCFSAVLLVSIFAVYSAN